MSPPTTILNLFGSSFSGLSLHHGGGVSAVPETVCRDLRLVDKIHGVYAVDDAREALGKAANFLSVCLAPHMFVQGMLNEVTVHKEIACG